MIPLRPDDSYVAGMWTKGLPQDLMWNVDNSPSTGKWLEVEKAKPRPATTAPTWSWASQARGVYFSQEQRLSAKLLDCRSTPVGPLHLGRVADASIVLQGHTCLANLHCCDESWRLCIMASESTINVRADLARLRFNADYDLGTGAGLVLCSEAQLQASTSG